MNKDKNSREPDAFAPEIVAIEREIVEFFAVKASEYTGRNSIIAKVMTYFCTRRKLTQQELQILTGYSAGTISKSVHQLLEMNVITKEIIPGTHKHIYKMEKLPFISPRYFLRTESVMDEKIQELKEMKETLDANAKEMEKLEAYNKVYTTITELLELLPKVHVFIEKLEEQLKQN